MGRTKITTSSVKTISKVKPKASTSTHGPSPASLLQKASNLVAQCDYDLALKFINRVLQTPALEDSLELDALDLLGVVQLEVGQLDSALEIYTRISNHKSAPPTAFLHLAQLTSSNDPLLSLDHYTRAIQLLTPMLPSSSTTIVRAYVSMAEIHMDPNHSLCEEEGAAERCTSLLSLALVVCPDHPEALQCLASVRLSESNPSEAKSLLRKSYDSWKNYDMDDERVPQLETRLNLARLCVEVEMFNEALEILDGVLKEDDEDVEAWYISGWVHTLKAGLDPATSIAVQDMEVEQREAAQDAKLCLERCRLIYVQTAYDDTQLLQHVNELLSQLDNLGVKLAADELEHDGDWEDGWEDEESDEERNGDIDMR